MTPKIDQGISDFLEVVVDSNIKNFEVQVHDGNQKGEGFLGEITFVSLKNKTTGEDINIVIKQVRASETEKTRTLMTSTYFNEIHYYTKIFPTLLNFQKSYPGIRKFDNFPKCFATSLEPGFEKLALENLKFKNYEMHPKSEPFNPKSFEKLFTIYGEYHALGFAFKHHHPEEFLEITKDLANNWLVMTASNDIMGTYLKYIFGKIKKNLEEAGEDKLLDDKFQKYVDAPSDIITQCATCKDSYSYGTIAHGDCWSNNMMIKYNSSREIDHVKLLDFQIGMVASPMLDLCYSFYSGAGKESLDNLENLLKTYHKVLSETLKKYGCNPEEIYPYEVLKKEWKEKSKFGFILGLMLWMTKLATDLTELPSVNEMLDNNIEFTQPEDFGIKYNEEAYKKLSLDIIKHMHENNFL